ncbi:G-type lectin S-receptor-like serine/threonine-protein kinase At4g27290 [Arachis ipaensis]|uniref:G-type lectin S-receptor-like serine/threonine-protein kinase At4g27290 n=1 Tax=Arachis ipaensis TaxID=130454 RepID=UPI000A2B272A|nr:G-type lectin S-receptor-like serine/threonine-protein kinase At4g27290 [Arachis ipaensis]
MSLKSCVIKFFLSFLFFVLLSSSSLDTIDRVQFLSDNGETIVSADETFALGFFSPGTSKNRYVGIWYNKVPKETVVWVANRNKPLTDSSGVLKVNDTGILVLLDRSNDMVVWSSNTTTTATGDPIAKLLNSGNLVVHERSKGDDDSRDFVWQSFDYPSDIILPGIKLGRNLVTGIKWSITSWSNSSDPSPGRYSLRFDIDGCPQTMMRDGSTKVFRFGSWNGVQLIGQAAVTTNSIVKYSYVFNEEEQYGMYELINSVAPHKLMLQSDGIIRRTTWSSEKSSWITIMSKRGDTCDNYATCGSYSSCNINRNPICSCLDGFVLSNKQDSSSDCVRRTSLNCRGDGFLKLSGLKIPDTEKSWYNRSISLEDCESGEFWKMKERLHETQRRESVFLIHISITIPLKNGNAKLSIQNNTDTIEVSMKKQYPEIDLLVSEQAPQSLSEKPVGSKSVWDENIRPRVGLALRYLNTLMAASKSSNIDKGEHGCILWFGDLSDMKELSPSLQDIYIRMAATELGKISDHLDEEIELPLFDMSTIISATNNFSAENILGKGGFGSVYKGILKDGQEIAVKRLSQNSSQGLQEFKNEAMHIAKLQHRNLVKLLGFCIQAEEILLVYEFMHNKSLDFFIFDHERGKLLNWPIRFLIINRIVKGLLYFHQNSRHRIVYRDLKAGNILLDNKLNPKISDFGLARSFVGNENEANTRHVAGTYGYLSPEYIVDGLYSTKSDIYSFGVLILEIVSGKRNRGFTHINHHFNLLGHAWKLFVEDKCLEMVNATFRDSIDSSPEEVIRSIHVGLLCVQRNPEDRPSMSDVLMMLSSEWPLPQPKKPEFFIERDVIVDDTSSSNHEIPSSINQLTISDINPR